MFFFLNNNIEMNEIHKTTKLSIIDINNIIEKRKEKNVKYINESDVLFYIYVHIKYLIH